MRLFHKIADSDSAAVRKFIVDHGLQGQIEFSNIAYDGDRSALFEASGREDVPVLLVDHVPIRGREAILDWLKTNLLRMRD